MDVATVRELDRLEAQVAAAERALEVEEHKATPSSVRLRQLGQDLLELRAQLNKYGATQRAPRHDGSAAGSVETAFAAQTKLATWQAIDPAQTLDLGGAQPVHGKGVAALLRALGQSAEEVVANPLLRRLILAAVAQSGKPNVLSAAKADELIALLCLKPARSDYHRIEHGDLARLAKVEAGTLDAAIQKLHAKWPPKAEILGPPWFFEFGLRASLLDAHKRALLAQVRSAAGRDRPEAVQKLVRTLEAMHGKPAQTAALVDKTLPAFLGNAAFIEAVAQTLGLPAQALPALAQDIRAGAPYLSLGEVFAPTVVYAQHRKMSDREFVAFVKTRPAASAALAEELGVVTPEVAAHLAGMRFAPGPRSPASQLLDVFEQVTALSQKRFFRAGDGSLDRDKISGELAKAGPLGELVVRFLPATL